MTEYGIKLVWAGWDNANVVGFSEQGYKRWRDKLPPGTRMLLYETMGNAPGANVKGTKSIVGEVEVAGSFDDGETVRAPDEPHDRVIPVTVVSPRGAGRPIPLDRIRTLIEDDKWPRMGESWKPLTDAQYQALIAERDRS
jgi:hypothetical protein